MNNQRAELYNPQLGLCIMYPSPGVVERIAADWDWVWLDGQHGQLGYAELIALVRACDVVHRPAFVRVPGHERGPIAQALDMGAAGVIVPQIHTVAQAEAVVEAAKFPPLGDRSYGGRRCIDFHGRAYADDANDRQKLIVQIESLEGIENAEAIAALPGVDGLFLGPDDIMMRLGGEMTAGCCAADLRSYMESVAAACHRHGKLSVMIGAGPEMLDICYSIRSSMVVGGGDVAFLAGSSKTASGAARRKLDETRINKDTEPKLLYHKNGNYAATY
jgi:4-hydroxy-2-oxoheptanedioate aldolase